MKRSHSVDFFVKTIILTSILLGTFQLWQNYSPYEEVAPIPETSNEIYQSAYSAAFGNIGVALSTRIGIGYQDAMSQTKSGKFYKEVTTIGTTSEEKKSIRSTMIADNMLIISEYLNLSRTDIKSLLDTTNDRKKTLEGFISQLEMRYKNSALSITSLEKQKQQLITYLSDIESQIEQVKTNMEGNFSASRAPETLENVDEYIALRREYTETFTDIVFINQFLKQHAFLNSYNIGILDTLINNKQAIIDETYVVIPDSGDQYLRPFDLIFDEAEIKAQQNSEEQ